jgi:hypothetical protein
VSPKERFRHQEKGPQAGPFSLSPARIRLLKAITSLLEKHHEQQILTQ